MTAKQPLPRQHQVSASDIASAMRPRLLRLRRALWLIALMVLGGVHPALAGERADARIFAAASLAGVIEEAARQGALAPDRHLRLIHASSGQLARQLMAGAEADLFIAADPRWTHELGRVPGISDGEPVPLFTGTLVLAGAADSTAEFDPVPRIFGGADLTSLLADGKLAMGEPAHVPAGTYGREALEWLGAWDSVAPRAAFADNVRQALAFVARGEAALAIVYLSDALAEPRVRVLARFPAASHRPIIYSGIAIAGGEAQVARRMLDYLRSDEASPLLERYGFAPLPPGQGPPS